MKQTINHLHERLARLQSSKRNKASQIARLKGYLRERGVSDATGLDTPVEILSEMVSKKCPGVHYRDKDDRSIVFEKEGKTIEVTYELIEDSATLSYIASHIVDQLRGDIVYDHQT